MMQFNSPFLRSTVNYLDPVDPKKLLRKRIAARWQRIEGMSGRQWKRHRRGLNRAAMAAHRKANP
jgi:hypothetical protein